MWGGTCVERELGEIEAIWFSPRRVYQREPRLLTLPPDLRRARI